MFKIFSIINVVLEDFQGNKHTYQNQPIMKQGEKTLYYTPMLNLLISKDSSLQEHEFHIWNQKSTNFEIIGSFPFLLDLYIENCTEILQFRFSKKHIKSPLCLSSISSKYSSLGEKTIKIKNSQESDKFFEKNQKTALLKRSTEKYIYEVEIALLKWRRLIDEEKINLNEASEIIGWPRKTLDDYFMQFKKGKRLHFDFHKFKNCKMGVLRKYVKSNGNDLFYKSRLLQTEEISVSDYQSQPTEQFSMPICAVSLGNEKIVEENSKSSIQEPFNPQLINFIISNQKFVSLEGNPNNFKYWVRDTNLEYELYNLKEQQHPERQIGHQVLNDSLINSPDDSYQLYTNPFNSQYSKFLTINQQ